MQVQDKRRVIRRRILAIAAGGAALGIGVSATLAAWTDTEWVFGGNGAGGPGIGTSSFSVQQNTVAPFAAGTWTDETDSPGGEIVFTPDATALTPGDAVYSPMALRTAPTSIAGDVELQPAESAGLPGVADPTGLLFAALNVRVVTDDAPFTCDDAAFSGALTLIADGPLATTGGSAVQPLLGEADSTQYYCFEVSLPDPLVLAPGTTAADYMGRTVAPAWEFTAES